MANSNTVYLLDASIYIFRAWFGYPDTITDDRGRSVNAVYGYWRQLLRGLNESQPKFMLAAFDESLFTGFRHQLYPDYKANRALPDEALAYQLALCRVLTEAIGVTARASRLYEADDILATAATVARLDGSQVQVISRDKDLAQVVGPGDSWWDWADGKRLSHSQLCSHWGVDTAYIADLLALAGDSADNIPGIPGVGLKSATQLVARFGPLEAIYQGLEHLAELPMRGAAALQKRLAEHQEQVFLYRELTRLHSVDEPITLADMQVNASDPTYLPALLQELGLGPAFIKEWERHTA